MYDVRNGSWHTEDMDEVMPNLFVCWLIYPRSFDLDRKIRRLIDDQEILDRLRENERRKTIGRFLSVRDLPESNELSDRSPGSGDLLPGPSRTGNLSQTPGRGVSYSGPSRAVSPPRCGRAGSFQRSDTQRTPVNREKWNVWQSPPDHGTRPTQRASSSWDLKGLPHFTDKNGIEVFNVSKVGHTTHGFHHRDPFTAVHDRLRDLDFKEPGHRFDHVDDSIVSAYTTALTCDRDFNIRRVLTLKSKSLTPTQVKKALCVSVKFCGLDYSYLVVFLPLDEETIENLPNDVLRVLNILLAAVAIGYPDNLVKVSDADMAESRRVVVAELRRRGFVECAQTVQFSGLPSAPSTSQVNAKQPKAKGKARAFEPQLRHPNGSDTESLPPRREPKLDIPVLTPETLSNGSESPSSAGEGARAPRFEEIIDPEGPVKGDKA